MSKSISSSSKKKKGLGRKQRRSSASHGTWSFPAKLRNEEVILHSILPLYSQEFYSGIVKDVRNLITQLVRNHGFTDGAKRYNVIKNYTIQLVEKRKPENPAWLATSDIYSVPSLLGKDFIQLIVDNLKCTDEALLPKYYQCINTILNIVRAVDGLSKPEFNSVEERSKPIDKELLTSFETYVSKKLTTMRFSSEVNLFRYRFNLRKNGPNGKPKIESSIDEAVTLMKGKLNKPFQRLCEELNIGYLHSYLSGLVESHSATSQQDPDSKKDITLLRKLVSVPDSGMKTRIVAIVDFWTQLALEPFRAHVQEVTKRMFSKTDFRLNQDDGVAAMVDFQNRCLKRDTVGSITLDVKHLKFYDISSWTDRFHRDLQKIVVKELFSPRLAEAWAQLVVHCVWYSPDLKRNVRYGQGQGMGTNGSFDVATLTDHLFINYIYDEVSSIKGVFPQNACYGKVGDDLWIYDPEGLIKKFYGKINLPINLSKSKEYSEAGSVAEFCSRTFLNGTDVSRISPKIINRSKDFRYIPTLLALCASRGISVSCSSFPQLQRKLKNGKATYHDKLQDWIVGYLVLGYLEHSPKFHALDIDYLEAGNWLASDRVRDLLVNPTYMSRLATAYSIVNIAEAYKDIMGKVEELWTDAPELTSWAMSQGDINLWDPQDDSSISCREVSDNCSVLTPKQIIVIGRLVDQHQLVNDRFMEVEEQAAEFSDTKDILDVAKAIQDISNRSCYDQGNINYDQKRVFNTQFGIVKVLDRLDEGFETLQLDNSELGVLYDLDLFDVIQDRSGLLLSVRLTA